MIEILEEAPDRILLRLDPGGPVELTELTESFAGLARLYERHHRITGEPAPKLYVTRIETGSVIAEIVPYAIIMGALTISTMDAAIIVGDFTRRISAAISAFADPFEVRTEIGDSPASQEDAEDIAAFVKPLAGKKGASLGISHARLEKTDGNRKTVVEYKFDEAEINRAAVNIDNALLTTGLVPRLIPESVEGPILPEVMLFFEQASTKPGKERGRTGDRGIVPDVSDKVLPVYFRKSFQDLKDQMVRGEINPLTHAFVVDVHVQQIEGAPKGYIVTNVHEVISIDETEPG